MSEPAEFAGGNDRLQAKRAYRRFEREPWHVLVVREQEGKALAVRGHHACSEVLRLGVAARKQRKPHTGQARLVSARATRVRATVETPAQQGKLQNQPAPIAQTQRHGRGAPEAGVLFAEAADAGHGRRVVDVHQRQRRACKPINAGNARLSVSAARDKRKSRKVLERRNTTQRRTAIKSGLTRSARPALVPRVQQAQRVPSGVIVRRRQQEQRRQRERAR